MPGVVELPLDDSFQQHLSSWHRRKPPAWPFVLFDIHSDKTTLAVLLKGATMNSPLAAFAAAPATELDSFWMPFTANRQFKAQPRMLQSAEGVFYTDVDGRQILDGTAGLWCCNAGHGRREIAEA